MGDPIQWVDHFRANLFKAHFLSLLIHKVTPRA